MALVTYPLNGVTYGAEDAETYLSTRTSGVFSAEDNFPISVTGQRQITIGTGLAWINNTKFAGKSVCNTADVSLPVAVADGAMGRIDRVVLRFDRDANESVLAIKAGVPASDPVPPDVERTELVYELGLYTILVPAASLTVELTDIASTMLDESVCGLMRDGVTGIPTDLLQKQTAELVEYLQKLAESAASGSLLDGSVTTPKFASDAVAPFAASNLILSCLTTDTTHALTGLNGAEGLLTCAFTADADFAEGNTFTVDGTAYTIQMQDGSDAKAGLFVAGAKVQVLVDTEGQSVNFKAAGGKGGMKKYFLSAVSGTSISNYETVSIPYEGKPAYLLAHAEYSYYTKPNAPTEPYLGGLGSGFQVATKFTENEMGWSVPSTSGGKYRFWFDYENHTITLGAMSGYDSINSWYQYVTVAAELITEEE